MGCAYTPGLTVAADVVVRKVRRLPLPGQVLVGVGQVVQADDVVAQASLPGEVRPLNVAHQLGITPEEVPAAMLKRVGDPVAAGEPLARTRGLWGWFRSEVCSPIDGTVESVSRVTGQVIVRGQPTVVRKAAYARGRIVAVQEGLSATVEVRGTFVQGVFGIGGEVNGVLETVVARPDQVLDADRLTPAHRGKILVGGSLVTAGALRAAIALGVRGVVVGGLHDADLRGLLGYDLGVAITGEEKLGLTLVLTEGFGPTVMAQRTFDLLARQAGRLASMNGATQIRAGVIRPEVLVPLDETGSAAEGAPARELPVGDLRVGVPVRIIREPYFGRIGRCAALPSEPVELATEARVRVLEVEIDDGRRVTVPRANVELIQQ